MTAIQLNSGYTALVDDIDFDRINRFTWKALVGESPQGQRWYAYRNAGGKLVGMHTEILGAKPGLMIDHVDGNGLNNCRSNLRYATNSQNQQNRRKHSKAASQFKGVTVLPVRYVARIKVGKKSLYLGTFDSEEEAARAYDAAARQHFQERACLNFP